MCLAVLCALDQQELFRLLGRCEMSVAVGDRYDVVGKAMDDQDRTRIDLADYVHRPHVAYINASPLTCDPYRHRSKGHCRQMNEMLKTRIDHARSIAETAIIHDGTNLLIMGRSQDSGCATHRDAKQANPT